MANEEQAVELVAELGASSYVEAGFGSGPFRYRYPATEKRRIWYIVLVGGGRVLAGFLLKRKYRNGVGAPGSWANPETSPAWVPFKDVDDGERDLRPPVPIPIRDLYPEETLGVGFAGLEVYNRAVMSPSQDSMLASISRKADRILEGVESIAEEL